MTMPGTETLDRIYLEWSQFTAARNKREIDALALLEWLDRKGGLGTHAHDRIRNMIKNLSI
jgi:hypothetical protein